MFNIKNTIIIKLRIVIKINSKLRPLELNPNLAFSIYSFDVGIEKSVEASKSQLC